ncbi:MAG: hypothetical protein M0Q38_13090 [Bacteroidales bacterium]|jgi:hypothetical protein|nr:hypothetical protein [Bacteroidales bacterium]
MEAGKHTEQDSLTIVEFAEKLPFPHANSYKKKRNDFPVTEIIMSSSSPVPYIAPQDSVLFLKCTLRTNALGVICPSGDDRVQVSD